MEKKSVQTTVIGSYPVDLNNIKIMNSYFNQELFSWDPVIKSAVDDMIKAGIDIVSDGQTRDPFTNIYIRKLKGCRIRSRPEIIGKVEYNGPITVDDIKYVSSIIPKENNVIGLIAGPFTLFKSCVNNFYKDEKQLCFDFAKALNNEAINLSKHCNIISVDEPFFSLGMPEYASDLIKTVIKNVNCTIRLHSCGDVSEIIPDLINLPVDILSHEFKATPKLFDCFKEYDFKQHICLGSVRSDDPRVESVDEIKKHIKKGIDVFDKKIVQISPDCGLRMQSRSVAFEKLKNLAFACRDIYG